MAERGVNRVILVGNLGQDPEVRYMPNGGAVASITVATSEAWRDKLSGEQKEKTEWHRVVLFGKLAEVAGEYLRKGSKVYIEGQLQTRKWQDTNGIDRYTTEVVVKANGTMQMLGGSNQSQRQSGNEVAQEGQQQTPATPAKNASTKGKSKGTKGSAVPPSQQQGGEFPPMDFDDSIPF